MKDGVDGEDADLQEGDKCDAQYDDGEMYEAKIVFRTGLYFHNTVTIFV